MSTLSQLQDHIAKWEGGYVNNPNDHGGETMRGITWTTFKSVAPKIGIPATRERFYKLDDNDFRAFVKHFWDISKADKLNPSIGAFVTQFRWGGPGRIPMFFNAIFQEKGITDRVPASTYLTESNIKNINKLDSTWLFNRLHSLRIAQHKSQAQKPGQSGFKDGWINRANSFYALFNLEKKK